MRTSRDGETDGENLTRVSLADPPAAYTVSTAFFYLYISSTKRALFSLAGPYLSPCELSDVSLGDEFDGNTSGIPTTFASWISRWSRY
jgi:hypothetical protein